MLMMKKKTIALTSTITKLKLYYNFNKQIDKNMLPVCLETLIFCKFFNEPIENKVFYH